MRRFAKTFAQPLRPSDVAPKSNQFTIDLMGLDLNDDHLEQIRSEAVKAAMVAAAGLVKRGGNAFDSFGTFSTFSTFSTFGSGVADLPQVDLPASLDAGAAQAIATTLGGRIKRGKE